MIRIGSRVRILYNTEPDEQWTVDKVGVVTGIEFGADYPYEVEHSERDAFGRMNPLYYADWELLEI